MSSDAIRKKNNDNALSLFFKLGMKNERLVYGWQKILENITCGYGDHK